MLKFFNNNFKKNKNIFNYYYYIFFLEIFFYKINNFQFFRFNFKLYDILYKKKINFLC